MTDFFVDVTIRLQTTPKIEWHTMFVEDPPVSVIPRPPRDLVFLAGTSGSQYGANDL